MRRMLFALLFLVSTAVPLEAADGLDAARDLYAAAAYEEALAMLQRLQASPEPPPPAELHQERALCLLALNRGEEAAEAIAAVVQAQPLYVPDESLVSPRVRAAFQEVRTRLTPEIARAHFAEGRDRFDRKDYEGAIDRFDIVLELTRDFGPAALDDVALADVRMLSDGFRTLSQTALAEAEQARAAAAQAPPEEEELAVGRIFDQSTPGVTPPVVVKQNVPEWRPFMGTPPSIDGLMGVTIDEQGRVEHANVIRSLHSAYDRLLLQAASAWSYVPATLNGEPVKFRKTIRLALR